MSEPKTTEEQSETFTMAECEAAARYLELRDVNPADMHSMIAFLADANCTTKDHAMLGVVEMTELEYPDVMTQAPGRQREMLLGTARAICLSFAMEATGALDVATEETGS